MGIEIKTINTVISNAETFINKRNSGELKSLKTFSNKLNNALLEGVD